MHNRKTRQFQATVLILAIGLAQHGIGQTTATGSATAQKSARADSTPISTQERARVLKYCDKDGGYKDKHGGYYNPTAGTYKDEKGGVVDNWRGYTYEDGSYKSGAGDFYDAPTRTIKLTTGENVKAPPDSTAAEIIKLMRENVEENGLYDKDFISKDMMKVIALEHPAGATNPARSK
jgi:hypothetical protein